MCTSYPLLYDIYLWKETRFCPVLMGGTKALSKTLNVMETDQKVHIHKDDAVAITAANRKRDQTMRADKYKHLFTKELLMGPNAVRLLDEILDNSPIHGGRVLDLGCGTGLTSYFMAKETDVSQIFAMDLWISPSDNWRRIKQWNLDHKIIPLHGDARELPFPEDFFDAVICIDAFHYFGLEEGFFAEKILSLIRRGGQALISVPGVKAELDEDSTRILSEWAGGEATFFHTCDWWRAHIAKCCEDQVTVNVYESFQFMQPWQDWFDSGHEYAGSDQEYMYKGLDQKLNFVMISVRKK